MAGSRNVLLVANRTATTTRLHEEVERKAREEATRFHLVVPAKPPGVHRVTDPEVAGRQEAYARLEAALPTLSEAAGSPVTGEVGAPDPLAAIHDALGRQGFDEIVISTFSRRVSRWLRLDLPSKARGLGLPVVHVEVEMAPGEATPAESADTPPPPESGAVAASPAGPTTVKDAMNESVVTVGPDDTLREAGRRMTEHNVGAAIVMDSEGSVPGIITERDLLRSTGRSEDIDRERVRDHVISQVIYAQEDWPLETAAEKMTGEALRHVVVLGQSGDPVAILSMRDIVRCWTSGTAGEDASPQAAAG